jgi:hypothetical protein
VSGTAAHQRQAARALQPASPRSCRLEAPAGSAPFAPLFVKLLRKGRTFLGIPGAAWTRCLCGLWGHSEKGGSQGVGTSTLPSRAVWPASQSRLRVWAPGAGGVRRRQVQPGTWVCSDWGSQHAKQPQSFFFFLILNFIYLFFTPVRSESAPAGGNKGPGKRKL